MVGVFSLLLLVNSSLMKIRVLVGILFWLAPLLWQLLLGVLSCLIAGLLLILLFVQSLRSLLGTLSLKGPGFILPCGLLAGWTALIAPDLLSLWLFVIFGMFTCVRFVLYLWRFVLTFFVCVTPLM